MSIHPSIITPQQPSIASGIPDPKYQTKLNQNKNKTNPYLGMNQRRKNVEISIFSMGKDEGIKERIES
ncbi:hypothetical protein BOTCAL_0104g00050 [Botryotinia calthae]|uniref:Uncharacterized protein n=1 Tax=Botryotinia calthae TaxID=38488 RepID=A0A4Y8D6C6_9HELO|nr:hypothetical protein BOTCAL_0104g00050 [Botryotinia calthae]